VLWIHIGFKADSDPALQVNGFDHQNLLHLAADKIPIFDIYKIASYLSRGLHEGRPSNRRSLQPSKENNKHFKDEFFEFLHFLDMPSADPDPADQNQCGTMWFWIQIQIHNTGYLVATLCGWICKISAEN
jgi:hypothetical protein